jgi:hypothetical protein
MIDDTEIRKLADYLLRTRGEDARDFVEGRIESSDQPEEWQRVAEVMNELLGSPQHASAQTTRRA